MTYNDEMVDRIADADADDLDEYETLDYLLNACLTYQDRLAGVEQALADTRRDERHDVDAITEADFERLTNALFAVGTVREALNYRIKAANERLHELDEQVPSFDELPTVEVAIDVETHVSAICPECGETVTQQDTGYESTLLYTNCPCGQRFVIDRS